MCLKINFFFFNWGATPELTPGSVLGDYSGNAGPYGVLNWTLVIFAQVKSPTCCTVSGPTITFFGKHLTFTIKAPSFPACPSRVELKFGRRKKLVGGDFFAWCLGGSWRAPVDYVGWLHFQVPRYHCPYPSLPENFKQRKQLCQWKSKN